MVVIAIVTLHCCHMIVICKNHLIDDISYREMYNHHRKHENIADKRIQRLRKQLLDEMDYADIGRLAIGKWGAFLVSVWHKSVSASSTRYSSVSCWTRSTKHSWSGTAYLSSTRERILPQQEMGRQTMMMKFRELPAYPSSCWFSCLWCYSSPSRFSGMCARWDSSVSSQTCPCSWASSVCSSTYV